MMLFTAASLGRAQGVATNNASGPAAPSGIDPTLQKALEQFIATEKAREASIHFLHFVLERRSTFIEADGSVVKPPMPTHLEGWVDTTSGVRRYEYKPNVSSWIDGAAPFIAENETEINDGKRQYHLDDRTDLDNIPSGPAFQLNNPSFDAMPQEDGSSNAYFALNAAQAVLVNLQGAKPAPGGFGPDLRAQWTTWDGLKVLEIDEAFTNPGDTVVSQRQVYRLDPGHALALVSYEMAFPKLDKRDTPRNVYAVDRFAKTPAGFFYPAVYRTNYTASGTDKLDNTSSQEVTTITTYEPLTALPEHILDLPKPKGREFVATDNSVVQPAAMRVTVVDTQTKKPVANAPVKVRIAQQKEVMLKTGADGSVMVPLPKEEVRYLAISCDVVPYVPQKTRWSRYTNPLRLPAQFEMDLAVGSPIFGRVQNEAGEPVAGATLAVAVFGPRDSNPSFSNRFDLWFPETKTDKQGKWRLERFPAALDGLSLRVSHPDYEASTDYGSQDYLSLTQLPLSSLRDGTSVIVLKRGSTLTGQVLGPDGKPVAGAHLIVGRDMWGTNLPEAKTDATGHFAFKGMASGDNFLTIQAAGCKPKALAISPPQTQALGTIQLEKGRVLRGHLVDDAGKPLAGFRIVADTWNKLRTIDYEMKSDANGDFSWDGAPDEPVTYEIMRGEKDPMIYDYALQAADAVQTVSMKAPLHLTAQVVDAKTGAPIAKFRVTPGLVFPNSPEPSWESQDLKNCVTGAYEWKSDRMGVGYAFKVEAEGYETVISDTYAAKQSEYTAVFKLVPVTK